MAQDEELRALEREARAEPSAGAWSKLAFALARAGRASEVEPAACRALILDASDPARALLAPHWNEFGLPSISAPWRGLQKTSRPRSLLVGDNPHPNSKHADLGEGLLLYEAERSTSGASTLVAVDVFTGSRRWLQKNVPASTLLVANDRIVVFGRTPGGVTVAQLDRRTGETVSPIHHVSAAGWVPTSVIPLDERTVAVAADSGPWRFDGIKPLRLIVFDFVGSRTVSDFRLPPGDPARVVVTSGVIYADGQPDIVALTLNGRERWRLPAHRILAALDGKILAICDEPTCSLAWFDAASGSLLERRELAPNEDGDLPFHALVNPGYATLRYHDRLVGLDLDTLAESWELDLAGDSEVVGTADALLVVTEHPLRAFVNATVGPRQELEAVTALDPSSGAELSRIEFPRTVDAGTASDPEAVAGQSILIAGRMLLPSASRQPTFFAIDDAAFTSPSRPPSPHATPSPGSRRDT